MELFIVRHGETVENRERIIQGHLPGQLTEKGIEQAKKLAKRLEKVKFDKIFCSDLQRCLDTAKEVIEYQHYTPFEETKSLREINWGSFQGKHRKEVDLGTPPPDAETPGQIKSRAADLLINTYREHKGQKILFITHGGFINALLSNIMNEDVHSYTQYQRQQNTAVNVVKMSDCNNFVVMYNDARHLE